MQQPLYFDNSSSRSQYEGSDTDDSTRLSDTDLTDLGSDNSDNKPSPEEYVQSYYSINEAELSKQSYAKSTTRALEYLEEQ
jgi:hypothetical protein